MISLPDKPTLGDLQQYLRKIVVERGFDDEKPSEVFTVMVEEVGELAKALRKAGGQKTGEHSKQHDLEEEVADVLFMLTDLANRLGIDLEKAFRAKEEKNKGRTWA